MTDGEIEIKLHEIARTIDQYGVVTNLSKNEMRLIADRFSELSKKDKERWQR